MSSDSQRPPPRNALQRRLSSQPPPAAEDAAPARGPELPDWRSDRFAELAAAEASEYAKPEPGSSSTAAIARVSSRAASGAAHGLASASLGTARLTAAGVRSTARAALFTGGALGRGLLRLLDVLGGAVIALGRGLGRGSVVVAGATGDAASRGLAQGGSRLWSRRRTLSIAVGALAFAAGAFFTVRSYAPAGKAAMASGGSRFEAAMVGVGSGLHRQLVDLGLAEPIPEAADKPEPPPHVPRYLLEITTVPEGATASFAGQELPTPATFELEALPEPPLRVTIRKPGLAPVVRRLDADDFTADGARLRHSLRVTLRAASAHAVPQGAPAAESAAAPPVAPPPARTVPTQLMPETDVPAAPF